MNLQASLGLHRFLEAIKHGEDLGTLLAELADARQTPAGADLLGGAVSGLLAAFVYIRQAGYSPQCADADIHAFLQGTPQGMAADLTAGLDGGDLEVLATRLSALVSIVDELRDEVKLREIPALANESPVNVRG